MQLAPPPQHVRQKGLLFSNGGEGLLDGGERLFHLTRARLRLTQRDQRPWQTQPVAERQGGIYAMPNQRDAFVSSTLLGHRPTAINRAASHKLGELLFARESEEAFGDFLQIARLAKVQVKTACV